MVKIYLMTCLLYTSFAAMDDIVAGAEVLENVIKNISLVGNALD